MPADLHELRMGLQDIAVQEVENLCTMYILTLKSGNRFLVDTSKEQRNTEGNYRLRLMA